MIEKNYKEDFPLLHTNKTIYIDNAATAQKPAVVIEAEKRFYEESNANPLRGFYPLSLAATEAYEDARKVVRDFIHADSEKDFAFFRHRRRRVLGHDARGRIRRKLRRRLHKKIP